MIYPIVLHKDRESDFGVTVPDLPGCFSAGTTVDEAVAMAKEAIEGHIGVLIDHGEPVPPPGDIANHQKNPDYKGGIWGFVSIDPANLRTRAVRIQVTIPERTLDVIDRFARERGSTRSGLLAEAAMAMIGREDLPKAKRGKPAQRSVKTAKRR